MYVCLCVNKTESDIRETIRQGIVDLDTLMEKTGAGVGCGTCQMWLKKIITEEAISSLSF